MDGGQSNLVGLAGQPLLVDGVEFRVAPLGGMANAEHLVIVKPMEAVEAYIELVASLEAPRIVELGIAYGGSVGLLALSASPAQLSAIELSADRVPLLDELLEQRGLSGRVRLHYDTDQADAERVRAIVNEDFGDDPLDLVIDDASHLYDESVASFECLFPRLRPGGRYIIEDWSCDHGIRSLLAEALVSPSPEHRSWAEAAVRGDISSVHVGQAPQTAVAVSALEANGPSSVVRRPSPVARRHCRA